VVGLRREVASMIGSEFAEKMWFWVQLQGITRDSYFLLSGRGEDGMKN
jgi:hypothetical protein